MTGLPEIFRAPRRLDGGAVKASLNADGDVELLDWDGKAWAPAKGIDFASFMAAVPASPEFLSRLGVPPEPSAG